MFSNKVVVVLINKVDVVQTVWYYDKSASKVTSISTPTLKYSTGKSKRHIYRRITK